MNRYAATPLGQPGVAQAIRSGGIDLFSPLALTGAHINGQLEIAGRTLPVQSGRLSLQGSVSNLRKVLEGVELPFEVTYKATRGGRLGDLAIGLTGLFSRRWRNWLADRLLIVEMTTTRGDVGALRSMVESRLLGAYKGSGIEVTAYQPRLLLGEARALRTLTSVGATVALDIGFEVYEYATGTSQWGNPYLTTTQKRFQAGIVIASDIGLGGALAFYAVAWEVAIPVMFIWAIVADPVFASLPITSQLYEEERNLQRLN